MYIVLYSIAYTQYLSQVHRISCRESVDDRPARTCHAKGSRGPCFLAADAWT